MNYELNRRSLVVSSRQQKPLMKDYLWTRRIRTRKVFCRIMTENGKLYLKVLRVDVLRSKNNFCSWRKFLFLDIWYNLLSKLKALQFYFMKSSLKAFLFLFTTSLYCRSFFVYTFQQFSIILPPPLPTALMKVSHKARRQCSTLRDIIIVHLDDIHAKPSSFPSRLLPQFTSQFQEPWHTILLPFNVIWALTNYTMIHSLYLTLALFLFFIHPHSENLICRLN